MIISSIVMIIIIAVDLVTCITCLTMHIPKGSPTVAKSHTLYLKSHFKSLKSLKFQNLKSRKVETVISKFLYVQMREYTISTYVRKPDFPSKR